MSEDKLLTIRDVSLLLGLSEKEVVDLSQTGVIPAYKVGGVFLRFKRQQVEDFMKTFSSKRKVAEKDTLFVRFQDFFYFHDFYVLSALLIFLLLVVILKGY
ncbi:MAG: helix-turn-helix domain-containing protein [Candidatus Omnitrophica bacterium]|nr:helix-turn-helix domain-containing protein [Candidatus Omnitrophota bacterium]